MKKEAWWLATISTSVHVVKTLEQSTLSRRALGSSPRRPHVTGESSPPSHPNHRTKLAVVQSTV